VTAAFFAGAAPSAAGGERKEPGGEERKGKKTDMRAADRRDPVAAREKR